MTNKILAIVGVTMFDGQDFVEDATIVVEGAQIQAAGPRTGVEVPPAAQVLDAHGKTALPGFIDMHTHVAPQALPLWLAYGITTVKDVGNRFERILPLRDAERRGAIGSPRIYCCGPLIDGDPPFWPDHAIAVGTDDDALRAADMLAAHGADACKTYMMLPPARMRTFVGRAKEHRLSTSAHLGVTNASQAVEAGVAGLEHTAQSFYTSVVPEELIWPAEDQRRRGLGAFWANFVRGWAAVDLMAERPKRMADRLAAAGVYVNPTLVTLDRTVERGRIGVEALDADPAMAEYAVGARAQWRETRDRFVEGWTATDYETAARALEKVQALTGSMHRAGVRIHAATDAPFAYILPGSSFLREIELLVDAGLSTTDALRSATSVPAASLGAADLGRLRSGAQADIVVFDGDIRRDARVVRRVERVYKRGVELDRGRLFAAAREDRALAGAGGW